MAKLHELRKEQQESGKVGNVFYESILAPFYFRAGEHLATYIMMNTDEFGNVKPFSEEPDSDEDNADGDAGEEAEGEAAGGEGEPKEESKQEEVPAENGAPKTMMIDTTVSAAPSAPAENGTAQQNGEANEENYEQEALNYFSLAL